MPRFAVSLLLLLLLSLPATAAPSPEGRLELTEAGEPSIRIRIDDGEDEIVAIPRGEATIRSPEGLRFQAAAGERWRFAVVRGAPAKVLHGVEVGELPFRDKEGAVDAIRRWEARGHRPRLEVRGAVFGLGGRVMDNRRYSLRLATFEERREAEALLASLRAEGEKASLVEEVSTPSSGWVEIRGPRGVVATSSAFVVEGAGIEIPGVEKDIGYATHGREDRVYRGAVEFTRDARGKTAAINVLPLEQALPGIVPSEIFASAPVEALKAQAVAARGEVLAKIGLRHLGDPYHLCAEQHCQVFKGMGGEDPRTDAAVASTRGEVLVGRDGSLVDTVYSSTCGGHTENNEAAWGTPPDPHLRGVPDHEAMPAPGGDLPAFLSSEQRGMCSLASFARAEKYRWVRRFRGEEMDARAASLGIGAVRGLEVMARGVSGRATALRFVGSRGEATVEGELRIRRLLGNLNSSLFVVERDREGGGWLFRGAGWGHGVGMCQMGAIGRAELGQAHEAILRHYYSGAELVKLY